MDPVESNRRAPEETVDHVTGARRIPASWAGPGSGDGFVLLPDGRRYWGMFGAAGLLVRHVDEDGTARILLALRARQVAGGGGTWALPGGARDEHESPEEAAIREFEEEIGPLPLTLQVCGVHENPVVAGVWSYHTVAATVDERAEYLELPNWENDAVGWFTEDEALELPLFTPVAATLPLVLALFT